MTIRVIEEIDATAAEAWAYVGDFGGIARWSPHVAEVSTDGSGLGMIRTVRSKSGTVTVELLDQLDPHGFVLAYRVVSTDPPGPLAGSKARIALAEIAPRRTELTWSCEPPVGSPELEQLVSAGLAARVQALRETLKESH